MDEKEQKQISYLLAEIVRGITYNQNGFISLNKDSLLILADYLEEIGEQIKSIVVKENIISKQIIYTNFTKCFYLYESAVKNRIHQYAKLLVDCVYDNITCSSSSLEDLIWILILAFEKEYNLFMPSKLLKNE